MGGATSCQATLSLARGAIGHRVKIRLPRPGLRLAATRGVPGPLKAAYNISRPRYRRNGAEYHFRLDAPRSNTRGARLKLRFRVPPR